MDELYVTLREKGQKSLYFFTTAILMWNRVVQLPHLELSNFIQSVEAPHKQRKLLLIPRDCYKSTIGSKSFPLWVIIQPEFCGLPGREHRILLKSFSSVNAAKHLRSIRQQVERNDTLRWLYHDFLPDTRFTTWTDTNLLFPRDGMYGEDTIEAAGIDSHIVSRHYTLQIKDDIEDKESMESPTVRARVKTDYKASEALFADEQSAYDLLIGTRWGIDDVYSDIYEKESETYEIMCRPLHWTRSELEADLQKARELQRYPIWNMDPDTYAPDSKKTYFFFEELFPTESCARLRAKNGSFLYSQLYLNNPSDPSLVEFKSSDVQSFVFDPDGNILIEKDGQRETVSLDSLRTVLMWDPAMGTKDMKSGSRNAMVCVGRDTQNRLFVLETYAERSNPAFLYDRYISMHKRWQPKRSAIEAVNFSRMIKYPLMQRQMELGHTFPVVDLVPVGDKDARIRGLLPYCESHLLYVRRGLRDIVEELAGFPVLALKDLVDALAACLELLGPPQEAEQFTRSTRSGVIPFEEARLSTRCRRTGY